MINYEPFFRTLEKKKITKYKLTNKYGVSHSVIKRINKNEDISTSSIHTLCQILRCTVSEIVNIRYDEDYMPPVYETKIVQVIGGNGR